MSEDQPDHEPTTPYGAPEPTVRFNPQTGYPAGQQPPPYPGPQAPYPAPPQGYPAQYPAQPYPPQQYAQQPYGQPAYGYHRPEHPKATTALVLGLVAVVGAVAFAGLTLVVSPFAWAVGAKARREIRASGGYYGGESNATAGMVLGIVGTILLILGILAVIAFFVFLGLMVEGDWSWDTTGVGA